jgi:putative nucleotidyltransferase with HDIG domain
MGARQITCAEDAQAVLIELGAPDRLIRHGLLVLEAADELLRRMNDLDVGVDEVRVRAGAMLHDVGKILHPDELRAKGAKHEESGQALLLEHGVARAIARICVTHAQWAVHECELEDLLVAVADALWKGVRRPELEQRVVSDVAARLKSDAWSAFMNLDPCFERIADAGVERLGRSL